MPIELDPMPRRLRSLAFTGIALLVMLAPPVPVHGGGFDNAEAGGVVGDVDAPAEYKPVHLPISAKAARTWIALHETMVKPPPDGTPFGDVIAALKAASRGKDGEAPFEWYLKPLSLEVNKVSRTTPVPTSFVGHEEVSLEVYLGFLLEQLGLEYEVHDGTLIIDMECDDCPRKLTVTAAEAWTWRVLHEVVPVHFPDETPLKDVLLAVQRATVGKGKGGRGLVMHVDTVSLQKSNDGLDAKVSIDLERAPLCTALGLVLRQYDLHFGVRGDGVVLITTNWGDHDYEYGSHPDRRGRGGRLGSGPAL